MTPIVTSALTNPELSLAATMALKDISRDCTDSMKPYAEQVSSLVPAWRKIFRQYRIFVQVISSIQQSLSSGSLAPGECVRLMYPLGKMLSLLSPHEILPR